MIFVDCEAWGDCPALGQLTEFGAVEFETLSRFYGLVIKSAPDPSNPAVPLPTERLSAHKMTPVFMKFSGWLNKFSNPKFVSDNPAYDWQWINDGFLRTLGHNPFGFSARRIGDFYAGLQGDFFAKQNWKRLRVTKHDHNSVNDALGNAEAFARILKGER